jgi:hypothetical protein
LTNKEDNGPKRLETWDGAGSRMSGTAAAGLPFCDTVFRDALAGVSGAPPNLLDIAQNAAVSFAPKEAGDA